MQYVPCPTDKHDKTKQGWQYNTISNDHNLKIHRLNSKRLHIMTATKKMTFPILYYAVNKARLDKIKILLGTAHVHETFQSKRVLFIFV